MLGKGRAKPLDRSEIAILAKQIGCHPADLEAISIVESNGKGWFADGRLKILFEKHIFHRYCDPGLLPKARRRGLARKEWVSPQDGGYTDQRSPSQRYVLLEEAIKLDERAAFMSISMGTYQIMGFNHGMCGFVSPHEMFTKFCDDEEWQFRAFINYLRSKHLYSALRSRDFDAIEKGYNGGGLNGRYARKMYRESEKLRKTAWANWDRNAPDPPRPSIPIPPKSEESGSRWKSILRTFISGGSK